MTEKIDNEAIGALLLEINDRIGLIQKIFPRDKEILLKNFAAAAIHLALFAKELYEHENKNCIEPVKGKLMKRFLDECGCKDIKNV